MNLLEETAFSAQKVVYETQGNSVPNAPPPPPSDLIIRPEFKQRDYTSVAGDPLHKIELKEALLKRVKDIHLIKQYKKEIEKLKKEVQLRKSK